MGNHRHRPKLAFVDGSLYVVVDPMIRIQARPELRIETRGGDARWRFITLGLGKVDSGDYRETRRLLAGRGPITPAAAAQQTAA